MTVGDFKKICTVLDALAEPNRLQIVAALAREELWAARLLEELPVGQATLSHHMKILTVCGLVIPCRQGRRTCYRLDRGVLVDAALLLQGLAGEDPASATGKCLPAEMGNTAGKATTSGRAPETSGTVSGGNNRPVMPSCPQSLSAQGTGLSQPSREEEGGIPVPLVRSGHNRR